MKEATITIVTEPARRVVSEDGVTGLLWEVKARDLTGGVVSAAYSMYEGELWTLAEERRQLAINDVTTAVGERNRKAQGKELVYFGGPGPFPGELVKTPDIDGSGLLLEIVEGRVGGHFLVRKVDGNAIWVSYVERATSMVAPPVAVRWQKK